MGSPQQFGETQWLTLNAGNHWVIGQARPCGTPHCCLPDWHNGPHTLEKVKCRSESKRLAPARRSPRFIYTPFPWHELDLDLQAYVLLQLSEDRRELLSQLARLARAIRPLRAVILRAMQLDDGIDALLSTPSPPATASLGESIRHCEAHFGGCTALEIGAAKWMSACLSS